MLPLTYLSMTLWGNAAKHLGMWSSSAWIGVCAGESRGSDKKCRPTDSALHVRTGWPSHCKVRRLRSSKALSDFWQWKVLNQPLFITRWWPYMGKTVCPSSQWENGAHFRSACENLIDDLRQGQANNRHGQSHPQGGWLSEKWSVYHIANVGGEGGCQHWNNVGNCSWQVVLSAGVHTLGSKAAHQPAKGTAYGAHTSTSVSVSWRPRFTGVNCHRWW